MILSRGDVLEFDACQLQRSTPQENPMANNEDDNLKSLDHVEKEHILKILRHTGGNFGESCKIPGITRPTLRKKINDYGLREFIET